MAREDWLREYLELMRNQQALDHKESMDAIKGVHDNLQNHCDAQILTNRDVESRMSKAEVKIKKHDGLVKGAWGLISGLIISILCWVGALVWNLLKGDTK